MITLELAEQILQNTVDLLMPNAKKFMWELIQQIINGKIDDEKKIVIATTIAVILYMKGRTWLTELNEKYKFYQ